MFLHFYSFKRFLVRRSQTSTFLFLIVFVFIIATINNFSGLNMQLDNEHHPISTQYFKSSSSSIGKPALPERILLIEDDNSNYFTPRVNSTNSKGCYTSGSVSPEPGMKWACQCKQGFYGPNCAIPEVVMTSVCFEIPNYCSSFKVRDKPRRIVHFFNVIHHEFDHVKIQLGELGEVVDVFVFGESNRTTSGDELNELKFLPKMKEEGLFKEYQRKIIHVTIPSTEFTNDPAGGGWMTDAFIRNYMGEKGISRIDGLEDDDLVVLTDTDEFLNKDVLMFLKLHDGWPEPVRVNFRESEIAFFWRRTWQPKGPFVHFDVKRDPVACTVAMLRQVYENKIMTMRREWVTFETAALFQRALAERKAQYVKDGKHNVAANFEIGRFESSTAGFHCAWCFSQRIHEKWLAANKQERANWGNRERLNLENVEKQMKKDDLFQALQQNLYIVKPEYEGDPNFAPAYVWKNKEKFAYLLYPDA